MAAAPARVRDEPLVIDAPSIREDVDDASTAWRTEVRLRVLARAAAAPSGPMRIQRWAWLLAIVVHLIVVVGLRVMLRESRQAAVDPEVIRVDLVDPLAPEPPSPQPQPLPMLPPAAATPARRLPHASVVTRAPPAPASAPGAVDQTPSLHLFNPDGSASVPGDLAAQIDRARPVPNFIPLKIEPSPLLQDKRPLKVRPNHFAQYWNGTDGMPLHQTIWRYVTATKEFTAPWGGRYGCTWVLIIVACADVPDKPWTAPQTWKPATELDER